MQRVVLKTLSPIFNIRSSTITCIRGYYVITIILSVKLSRAISIILVEIELEQSDFHRGTTAVLCDFHRGITDLDIILSGVCHTFTPCYSKN